jgi:ribosome-associated protein YbcJ (S4-like RNA binding protein)
MIINGTMKVNSEIKNRRNAKKVGAKVYIMEKIYTVGIKNKTNNKP